MATSIQKIKVGQRVRFGSPWNRHEGVVIEDRGLLGAGGRQIVRLRYFVDHAGNGTLEPEETETAAENVEVIMGDEAPGAHSVSVQKRP